ncbi:GH1 family beta-glucosidase [Azohydromonas australica]|uniref:GH1 family beta-glucosidase n=1 Tax=Azohydromonas australica TaxID=364039 RepID=UPI0004279AD2|nr:GH1 family beta-glucosidase [Azohydromonas australica]
MTGLSRRTLFQLARAQAAAVAATGLAPVAPAAAAGVESTGEFPPDFLWGAATSSYQIEGAPKADGKGPSIWDTFAHTPGKIVDGSTGDVACDHYHRWREDIELMKRLGLQAYRFSISWPRIFPDGTGRPNQRGLDFYSRLVDGLLAAGIQPYATLFHWDLPQALQDRFGGWEGRETAHAFADYAGHVAAALSDRVKHFFTINEFFTFVELGHQIGIHAPGLQLPPARVNQVRHHALLAHGLAVQAIRARGRRGTLVGPAENIMTCVPVVETPEHVAASQAAMRDVNGGYTTAMLEGRYPARWLEQQGANAPRVLEGDMRTIGAPLDFFGANVYAPFFYVRAIHGDSGYEVIPLPETYPKFPQSSWLRMGPEGLYWAVRHLSSIWNVRHIHVTENGCGTKDTPNAAGELLDVDRIAYTRHYLQQLQRATAEGMPVRSYFHWSLMDNFEWADGLSTQRFGLVHVDFDTQRRTPKLSAEQYGAVIRHRRVV